MDTLISDIAAVIDLLHVERVDLLGWSFGADLASRVPLQRPERIRRLVLQAPALDFTHGEVPKYLLASFENLATPDVAGEVAQVVHGPGSPWERLDRLWPVIDQATADRVGYHQQDKARLASRLHEQLGIATNMDMMRALVSEPPTVSIMERVQDIACPTLVITGAHDHNVDPRRAERIARTIPNARMVTFTETAHMPDLEEPQAYVRCLVDFLN